MRDSDIKERKTFKINENIRIECRWIKTRYGFKHDATLYDGYQNRGTVKACYYNRTWESFEYESVIADCLRSRSSFTEEEQDVIMTCFRNRNTEELNKRFGFIKAIASLGEILSDDKKEQNDWKQRMLKAGMGNGLNFPADWDSLSEEEKQRRLDGALKQL